MSSHTSAAQKEAFANLQCPPPPLSPQREAEEIRVEKERKEAEIQALAQAAEMARIAKDLAEKEANRVTLERRKSRYRRQELAERQAKLAKLKAEEEARVCVGKGKRGLGGGGGCVTIRCG